MSQTKYIKFNPIKEEIDGKKAKSVIWTTQSIELAVKGLEQGKRLVANPFHENNIKILKGDLVFQRSDYEIQEWMKCRDDIIYFANTYCRLMTPEGIQNITLRNYQEKYLRQLIKTQLSIYCACRQSAKTTTSSIFLLHYICFNIDKNALVLGNKRKTAVEILDKIKKIYLELPFFLKPGVFKWNESELVLDNGCRIMAEATTINSGIGFTLHCVLADEFAHVPPNILDSFYGNLFPTVTAAKAKFIITSTQNGYNLFYRLYKAAEAGENDYMPYKTDWWEVPEWDPENNCWVPRDEEWHRKQVANYGSEEAFNRQFGTNFDVSAKTLVSQKVIAKKQQFELEEFVNGYIPGVLYDNCYYWKPGFEPHISFKKEFVITTIDLGEGLEQDYTAIHFYRLCSNDALECIGFFRANDIERDKIAFSLLTFLCLYGNMDRILLSFEKNTYGELFFEHMNKFALGNTGLISEKFDTSVYVKYFNENGTKYKYGIKITPGNKTPHCLLFKEDFERDKILNSSTIFMSELTNFSDDGSGHYKASFGHDDMVMCAVQLEFVKKTLQYKLFREEFESQNNIQKEDVYNPYEIAQIQLEEMNNELPNNFNYYDDYEYLKASTYNRLNKFN